MTGHLAADLTAAGVKSGEIISHCGNEGAFYLTVNFE